MLEVYPEDNFVGHPVRNGNVTVWSGAVGQLVRKEADFFYSILVVDINNNLKKGN